MLDVPELRLQIFRYLWISDVRPIRLVCKTWYPEADQVTWESIETLPPLLRLLPEDAWEQDMDTYSDMLAGSRSFPIAIRIKRALSPGDWAAVVERARFVKKYRASSMLKCGEDVFAAIVASPPPCVPLLSGLQTATLHFSYYRGRASFYKTFFDLLVPHIYITTLDCTADEELIPDPGVSLSRYSNLRSIRLNLEPGKYADSHTHIVPPWPTFVFDESHKPAQRYDVQFLRALERCPKLRDVNLKTDAQASLILLRTLSRNPTVQSLVLRYDADRGARYFAAELHSPSYSFPAFPALRELTIKGLKLADARRLLTSSSTRIPLEKIVIERHLYASRSDEFFIADKEELLDMLELVCTQLEGYRSLRVLRLEGNSTEAYPFTLRDLRPLSVFSEIREINLTMPLAPSLVDADCEIIAGWWPRLEVLMMGDEDIGDEGDAKCSLRGLLYIVARCPYLTDLHLPLDASVIPKVEPAPGDAHPPYQNLKLLYIGDAPIVDTEGVAQFLKTIFPRLRTLKYTWYGDHDDIDRRQAAWKRVVESVTGVAADDPLWL
ncbi:hypothetical protein BD626DRAFT_576123 [Schizophyllum amplum]|uniref:F-box domain-containing protein n=1 Tax=Schizophyllum amplum TaxID=97359 RepID=A0A550BU87_9AGAR|nr:hypothetical protein BD626DRAFT_576123 [Auriculariopsis ampla]